MEYFARIERTEGTFLVSFPDFPNINTYGPSLEAALENAAEALNGTLETEFERGYSLPVASDRGGRRSYHPIRVLPHIEIAYALKKLRNGHSQTDIARKLGISYQSYQKLENPRKCNPTVKTLERIAQVLGKELRITWG
ncbi:MAG TPA: helix-turn-helix domain-containing protein [Fibrobacteria bacterium]|nr:helix-turn-helix domain-containing protein [Fibrobacteria bacterium]